MAEEKKKDDGSSLGAGSKSGKENVTEPMAEEGKKKGQAETVDAGTKRKRRKKGEKSREGAASDSDEEEEDGEDMKTVGEEEEKENNTIPTLERNKPLRLGGEQSVVGSVQSVHNSRRTSFPGCTARVEDAAAIRVEEGGIVVPNSNESTNPSPSVVEADHIIKGAAPLVSHIDDADASPTHSLAGEGVIPPSSPADAARSPSNNSMITETNDSPANPSMSSTYPSWVDAAYEEEEGNDVVWFLLPGRRAVVVADAFDPTVPPHGVGEYALGLFKTATCQHHINNYRTASGETSLTA